MQNVVISVLVMNSLILIFFNFIFFLEMCMNEEKSLPVPVVCFCR